MLLKSPTLENFKGIREPVTIDFKPVTLLFGPNSAGKSTVVRSLHYLREMCSPDATAWNPGSSSNQTPSRILFLCIGTRLVFMVNYRRNYIPGGTYFFTVILQNRHSDYLTRHVNQLRQAMRELRAKKPFKIGAIVILPDHLHTIWHLPANDCDLSGRWKAIKSRFTRLVVQQDVAIARNKKGEHRLWQRRFWEHTIRDDQDYRRHVDYIHYNPVKHGWVKRVGEWPYSSFQKFVRLGTLPEKWGGGIIDVTGKSGE